MTSRVLHVWDLGSHPRIVCGARPDPSAMVAFVDSREIVHISDLPSSTCKRCRAVVARRARSREG